MEKENGHIRAASPLATTNGILSIAGLDPCSGAGLTADLKTFEAHGLYGLTVCTAITIQNDVAFKAAHWVDLEVILEQIETLFERFEIAVVKVGIVKNWQSLAMIIEKLFQLNTNIKIVLDPILKATAGSDFHENASTALLDSILDKVYVITPNYEEIQNLYPVKTATETIAHLSAQTNVYLKGGHRKDAPGLDILYTKNIAPLNIEPGQAKVYAKHGSGCVLSSAIASYLQLGLSLEKAVVKAKQYIETFLASNKSLLGNHSKLVAYDS